MEILKQYEVLLSAISEGENKFSFEIKDSFFKCFESTRITKGNLNANIEVFKKINQYEASIDIEGTVDTECDKCLSNYPLVISSSERLVFKLSEEDQPLDPMVVHLSEEVNEINFSSFFYEFIHLGLPVSPSCEAYKKDEIGPHCDEDVLNRYFSDEDSEEEETTPENGTWSALKDLNLN